MCPVHTAFWSPIPWRGIDVDQLEECRTCDRFVRTYLCKPRKITLVSRAILRSKISIRRRSKHHCTNTYLAACCGISCKLHERPFFSSPRPPKVHFFISLACLKLLLKYLNDAFPVQNIPSSIPSFFHFPVLLRKTLFWSMELKLSFINPLHAAVLITLAQISSVLMWTRWGRLRALFVCRASLLSCSFMKRKLNREQQILFDFTLYHQSYTTVPVLGTNRSELSSSFAVVSPFLLVRRTLPLLRLNISFHAHITPG